MNKEISIVVISCGEESEKDCLSAIEPFQDQVEIIKIKNVFPQIKALNQMISSVQTEYFIPLDADIVLDHDAWPRIKNAINKNSHDKNWHSILFRLYDTLTEKNILALKMNLHPVEWQPKPSGYRVLALHRSAGEALQQRLNNFISQCQKIFAG